MTTKNKLALSICLVLVLEALIYLWARYTATLNDGNFFAIQPEFIFDKCARNSGRISSFINLCILGMFGYLGLKHIYRNGHQKDLFRILILLYATNHLTHFFFVFQNFKHHQMTLSISDNLHGFITFMFIVAMPIILWSYQRLNNFLYILITLHLFNVSYFIMETFFNKIKPDKPAYHNQFGILITCMALLYILYRVVQENKKNRVGE